MKVMEWMMMKKGVPYIVVKSLMSLFEEMKTIIRVDFELAGV